MSFRYPLNPPHVVRACCTLASLAVIACGTEQLSSPRPGEGPSFAAGGKKAKPALTDASGPSLAIAGSAGTFTVSISNPTSAQYSAVSLQASIEQGMTSRAAGVALILCNGSGGVSGLLPVGGCVTPFAVSADNGAGGTGTLVPGSAKLVVNLVQSGIVLDTKTVRITLTAPNTKPFIKTLVANFNTFTIGGGAQDYTVTISNPTGADQSLLTIQAYFIQNGVAYAGYGTNVICGPGSGILPPGDCTFTWQTGSDLGSGTIPGSAVWRLELTQFASGTTTLLDFKTVNVTLVSSH